MKYFLTLLLIFAGFNLFAFSRQELDALRNNPEWLIGKGEATDETIADKAAINDLLSQISVQVESSFKDIVSEDNKDVKSYCESVVKTYSNARLDAAERNVFESGSKYVVYRFIRKADKNRIFADRERLVKDYALRGYEAENELRMGDALLNYYWALILLRTHPGWCCIDATLGERSEVLISYLPDRIRRIFSLLSFTVSKPRWDEADGLTEMEFNATFDGQPVRNLDVKYYRNKDWSLPIGMSEGTALLEYYAKPDELPEQIKLNVIYRYEDRANINADIARVMQEMTLPTYPESQFKLQIKEKTPVTYIPQPTLIAQNPAIDVENYAKLALNMCKALQNKNFESVEALCNEDGERYFEKMIKTGNARIVDNAPRITAEKVDGKTVLRGISMQFSFPKSGRKFVEPMVFSFDDNDKLDKITFGLTDKAVDDIFGSIKANPMEKKRIQCFVEDYKTAYCLKDISFVEKVFADNALIIVGSMLKDDSTDIEDMYKRLGNKWKATKFSKQDYIKNLRALFASNEYVNLKFEDNIILRDNNSQKSIFGIQIHQYYYSQHYADEGYLFLEFDLTDTDKPKIYVRTWQPQKNEDGSIFGIGHFNEGK